MMPLNFNVHYWGWTPPYPIVIGPYDQPYPFDSYAVYLSDQSRPPAMPSFEVVVSPLDPTEAIARWLYEGPEIDHWELQAYGISSWTTIQSVPNDSLPWVSISGPLSGNPARFRLVAFNGAGTIITPEVIYTFPA